MKTLCMAVLALALGAGLAAAHDGAHDEKAEAGAVTTLSGELVDMGCYLSHGGAGEKHAKCGKMCVMKGGQPLGLLTKDGALYLVVGDHGDEKSFAAAKEMAGENAKLTGKLLKKGGMQALMVSKVEKP
ncbi:MAG: hypothetical protein ACHQ51_13735 [Elusimicrobiota bacterium]